MRNFIALILAAGFISTAAIAGVPEALRIGAGVPMGDAKLKDISGSELTLNGAKGENGLLVVFSSNTCPYVLAWQDRYDQVAAMCKENGIGMILLNSNAARREDSDSFEAMKQLARENNYTYPYALDFNHEVADAFGAMKTPDVFLFNKAGSLVYRGAIDDNHKDATLVKEAYLKDAIASMLAGKEINPSTTLAIGCTIKRVE